MSENLAIVKCDCGCSILAFEKTDDGEVFIEAYEHGFYSHNSSKVGRYLRRLWSAICGKEYRLFDIVIGPEKFQALVNELKRLSEKSKDHLAREALWCKAKGNTPEASS